MIVPAHPDQENCVAHLCIDRVSVCSPVPYIIGLFNEYTYWSLCLLISLFICNIPDIENGSLSVSKY
jgi:hypothetical protein